MVATPTEQHHDDIFDCFNAIKPCLVEKPIVAKELGGAFFKAVKMVGYNLRFHSCVKKAKEWLSHKEIGKPIWARFTCAQYNDKPAYLRDGVILNWSHEIDLAMYLLGVDATVTGASASYDEDLADIDLWHAGCDCRTSIHLDYLTKWERRGFLIVGTEGSIKVDLVSRQAHLRDNDGNVTEILFGQDTFEANYIEEAKAFLDLLDGKDGSFGCTALEAMNVVRICLDAKEIARGR